MFAELACLAAGVAPGRLLRRNKKAQKLTGRATMTTIYALLFIMGAKIGGDAGLFSAIGELGAQALVISLCCTLGSVLCVIPAQRWFRSQGGERGEAPRGRLLAGLLGSACILAFFCLGLALASLDLLPPLMTGGELSTYLLWLLLFCVGMGLGFDLASLLIVREIGLRVALVPLLAISGTGLGAMLAAALLPEPGLRETAIVGAGFGYYSLSSVLISSREGLLALGSVALISNIFRELFTLLFTPLLVRFFGPLAPVAAAGAPGMDTCLPVIVHFTGERYGIISIFNGLVMTILVPLLVPLLLLFF